MLLQIIKKDLLDQLMSLRLVLTFLLVVSLMTVSGVMFKADYQSQTTHFSREVNANLDQLAAAAHSSSPVFQALSFGRQYIYRRPNQLGFLAEGREKDLPNAFQVNSFKLLGPFYTLRGNPFMWDFEALDWSYIFAFVLSFAGILLAYDGINGEKERGTLRLMLSNPVPRFKILLSRYLSTMLVLAIPVAVGAAIHLLIITSGGALSLTAADWGRVGITLLLGLVYVSIFVLLSLAVSSRTKEPALSLVVGLLVWIVLVLVIPAGGSFLARALAPLPPYERVQEEAQRAGQETFDRYNQLHPHKNNWIMSGNWSPREPLARAFEIDEATSRVIDAYRERQLRQIELGFGIARLSPSALFQHATQEVAGSGLVHYESFFREARDYRRALRVFLEQTYPYETTQTFERTKEYPKLDNMRLDFASIPKFEDKGVSGAEGLSKAIWDVTALLLINLTLFAAAHFLFLRCDVR